MVKNQGGQSIGAQMINATTGAAFAGIVTVYITIDAGTQAIGSVGSGICTSEGNGYYSYLPSKAETNGDLIAFTFTGTGAIPATIQVATLSDGQTASITAATNPSTLTIGDVLKLAYYELGSASPGESLDATQAQVGLQVANNFIDGMATENLFIYTVSRTIWTLTPNQQSYSIGPGGNVNSIPRPIFINQVGFIDTSQVPPFEYNLGLPLTEQGWASIPIKTQTNTYPVCAYYNPTFPTGTLSFWFIPTLGTLQGVIYAGTAISEFGGLTTPVTLPPGYRRFLVTNLAMELAGQLGITPLPTTQKNAIDSRANIMRANMRLLEMQVPRTGMIGSRQNVGSIYDFYAGIG